MPVKKRLAKVREHRITDAAVAAWRVLIAFQKRYGDDLPGDDAEREEYIAANNAIARELHLGPWEEDPIGVDDGEPPEWLAKMPDRLASYRQAQELRRALIRAAKRR